MIRNGTFGCSVATLALLLVPGLFAQERFLVLDEDFQVTCIAHATGDVVFGEVEEAGVVKSIRWSEADGKTVIADGANDTHVVACNADGTVAVGYFVEAGIHRPFRWSSATGLVELTLAGTDGGEARGCSADGAIVVGFFFIPQPFLPIERAFQWTESAGATFIPTLPFTAGTAKNVANSCSDAGAAFGWSSEDAGQRPFRYSPTTGATNLAATGDAPRAPARLAIGSSDGTAAAVNEADGFFGFSKTAVWRQGVGYQNLPLLTTDFGAQTVATCISSNGNLVAGEANVSGTTSRHAFRWSPTSGIVDMGTLGGASSRATAVTGDGKHIYGMADTQIGAEAFVWEAITGMRTLKTYAQGRLQNSPEISDWRFDKIVVSRDGHRMFVNGTRNDNLTRVLFLDIEPPVNAPPSVATMSPVVLECVDEAHTVLLSTTVDDIDGQNLTVRWKVDGFLRKTQNAVVPGSQVSFSFAYTHGVRNVVLEATDGHATTSLGTTVTVQDTIDPTIVVAPDTVVPTDPGEAFSTVELDPPTAEDSSGHPVALTSDAPAQFPLGETIVTWTGTDIGGNTATGTQKVTVEDREGPQILVAAKKRVFCDSGKLFSTFAFHVPETIDNVSPNVVPTSDAPARFPIGSTRVTWTATDEAGNQSSASTVLTVVNRTPKANAGKNVVVEAKSERGVRVTLDGSGSSDPDDHKLKYKWSAPGVKLAGSTKPKASGLFPVGSKNVKLTVTDAAGAKKVDTVRVTVKLKNSRPRPRGTQANEAFAAAVGTGGEVLLAAEPSAATVQAYANLQAADGLGIAAGDLVLWEEGQSPDDAMVKYAELRDLQRRHGLKAVRLLMTSYLETGDEAALTSAIYAHAGTLYATADLVE